MTITCKQCGIDFERPPKRGRTPRYCSDECRLEGKRSADRESRAARSAAGLCRESGCPERPAPGRSRCAVHLAAIAALVAAARAADPEKRRERDRAYYAADPERRRESARATRARYAARTVAEIETDRKRLRPDGVKRCRDCGKTLDLAEFYEDRTKADGLRISCRRCVAEYDTRRRSEDRARLLARWAEVDLWRCYLTGVDFEDEGPHALHVDHQWSLARGGPDVEENLFPASAVANIRKHARPFAEVLEEHHPGVLAAVADWPTIVIDLDTGEVTGAEDAVEFVGGLL